mmetsp:Transcript_51646/g.160801  ORF Transcript_51646/g.160801 Transcript_51646/m.160801 type:complete len:92 (+) Transcript_51646:135-410(+)
MQTLQLAQTTWQPPECRGGLIAAAVKLQITAGSSLFLEHVSRTAAASIGDQVHAWVNFQIESKMRLSVDPMRSRHTERKEKREECNLTTTK